MIIDSALVVLSLIVFLPALGALVLVFLPSDKTDALKLFAFAITVATFGLSAWMAIPAGEGDTSFRFEMGAAGMQNVFVLPWIESFNVEYAMGVDGISLPLVVLTTFLFVLAMAASWSIGKYVKAYCMLFLLLETGIVGVFVSLDFFLFYVFWEVMLLPMYFLIGVWGGPRREYAAIKFFLYTFLGGVFMLIAILMLYFTSDLMALDSADALREVHIRESVVQQWESNKQGGLDTPIHTFNLLALAKLAQTTDLFDRVILWGKSIQWWAFLLLFVGFLIKVPAVPLHTWLPDAHVEAPTPISMILAGILLKLGGYGIIRICYPICPDAGYDLAYFVCGVGIVSMVYGALAAMAQRDFKRLVAYSSVSHMGYVVLGIGVWRASEATFNPEYWNMGMNGAMFQMVAHGISSAGMFFLVGVIYDRVHHRNLNEFGGLYSRMPIYSGLSMVIFFAALGLPGLCGFIGEFFVVLAAWNFSHLLAIIAASVVVLTAGYILWTVQRVYLGAEYKGPHGDALSPMTMREMSIAGVLVVFTIVLGVYPQALFNYTEPSVNALVTDLGTRLQAAREEAADETVSHEQDDGRELRAARITTAAARPADVSIGAAPSASHLAGESPTDVPRSPLGEKTHPKHQP